MGLVDNFYPFEFVVTETPRSLQARPKSVQRWMTLVSEAARERMDEVVEQSWLDGRPLALSVFYFPPAPMDGDIDNIIKPIMDALNGVAYIDDREIERVVVQKFEPDLGWSFDQPSEMLARALDAEKPVVYVRVEDDLAWRRT